MARGLTDRCVAVAMDAQKDYVRPASADLVVGSAILHHLVEPAPFVEQAMRILRPGGAAIFFEPFEGGYAILRLICQEIVREAGRRKDDSSGGRPRAPGCNRVGAADFPGRPARLASAQRQMDVSARR